MGYYFEFSADKNKLLLETRNICFEHIISLINEGSLLDIISHPNQVKYSGQKMYVIDVDSYCCLVPFVKKQNEIFLKTIIPSRKATKYYLNKNSRGENDV